MKKFLSVICVLAILFSFAACGEDAETIITGRVLSVNDNELTLMTGGRTGGSTVKDNAVITIGEGCVWNLTGDCIVTSLTNNGTINFNGHIITIADGTTLH